MKCNKPYSVNSTNSRMGGSVTPKSYQKGGLVTPNPPPRSQNPPPPPKGVSKEEMQRRVAAKSKAKAQEQVRQIERERRYSEMDRRMNEGYRKATGRD